VPGGAVISRSPSRTTRSPSKTKKASFLAVVDMARRDDAGRAQFLEGGGPAAVVASVDRNRQ
jgi:hypothetical protein